MGKLFSSPQRNGFTLTELLVTIAVIGILSGLLFSGLSRARSSAQSAVCQNNLRQLGIALNLYLGDHTKYPAFYQDVQLSGAIWSDLLAPLSGAPVPEDNASVVFTGTGYSFRPLSSPIAPRTSVFACPAYNRLRGMFVSGRSLPVTYRFGSYGYNAFGTGSSSLAKPVKSFGLDRESWGKTSKPAAESDVVNPASMIAVGDSMLEHWDHDGAGHFAGFATVLKAAGQFAAFKRVLPGRKSASARL